MQQILSLVAAAAALATATPDTGAVTTSSPIAVSTCSVSDIYNAVSLAEFGLPISYRSIEHTFINEIPDGGYSRAPDTCAVAAITFADGRRWTAPRT